MAAAIVPLIAQLAPEIVSLVVGLIHGHAPVAEAARGSGTGPAKFADVFVAVMKDLASAHAVGSIPVLPDDPTVKLIIQSVVNSMQLMGGLGAAAKASPAPVAASVKSLTLAPGQAITISVAS